MLFGLFERSPRNVDDLQRIQDKVAFKLAHSHMKQVAKEIRQDFRQRFRSHNGQPRNFGQRALYLQPHGDNVVACDATGNIQGIVERPPGVMPSGPGHQPHSAAPTNLGNDYVLGQQVQNINTFQPGAIGGSVGVSRNGDYRLTEQVARTIDTPQMSELHPGRFFVPGRVSERLPVLQPTPASHLTLPSPPPSAEPSLYPRSRPASRNHDTVSLSSTNQISINGEAPQPVQASAMSSQHRRVFSAPPGVPTSGGLSSLQLFTSPQPLMVPFEQDAPSALDSPSTLHPNSPIPQDTAIDSQSRPVSSIAQLNVSPGQEDTSPHRRISNFPQGLPSPTHPNLRRPFLSPFPEVATTYDQIGPDEATRAFIDKLNSMGPPRNQPRNLEPTRYPSRAPLTRPVEDSNDSTMEALRAWSITLCEMLWEQTTRWNPENDLSEAYAKLFAVLAGLSSALDAAHYVPFQVLLDTMRSLQRFCFEMHRPRTQQDQLAFLIDLSQGIKDLTAELQAAFTSPTTSPNLVRSSTHFWSARSGGTGYQGATVTSSPAQPAAIRDSRYPVDDRSPPTDNSFSPISQATSHRLSYADTPRFGGNGLADEGSARNDRTNPAAEEGGHGAVSHTDNLLNSLTENETPLSQMRMVQTPQGSFAVPSPPQDSSAGGNPSVIGSTAVAMSAVPPVPMGASSVPVVAAPAPIPSLATPVPLSADILVQHPHPERNYRQAEFMASPRWSARLRLANLLNLSPFRK